MRYTFALALIFAVYGVVVLAAPAPVPVADPEPDPFDVSPFLERIGHSVLDVLDNTEWGKEAKANCVKRLVEIFNVVFDWADGAIKDTKKAGKQFGKDFIDVIG